MISRRYPEGISFGIRGSDKTWDYIDGGWPVTITGTGFTGVMSVTFGGVPAASFTVDSGTRITATTPLHNAGTVQLVVTGPGLSSQIPFDFI